MRPGSQIERFMFQDDRDCGDARWAEIFSANWLDIDSASISYLKPYASPAKCMEQ